MGLDNGILIRNTNRKEVCYPFKYSSIEHDSGLTICYWRKCWNLRNAILYGINGNTKSNNEYYNLDIHQVKVIRAIIKYYIFHPKAWESNNFWEHKEILHILIRDMWNLSVLILYMGRNPNKIVTFYDSY